jgi:hypothetical protein
MKTFLQQSLDYLQDQGKDISQLHYVVPSKRVGIFLNKMISQRMPQPIFEPTTQSIEQFVETTAAVKILPDIEILPYFYKAYCKVENPDTRDSFDSFIGWAPSILKDFNEIDRYLVDTDLFFNYLGNYKALDTTSHWSLDVDKSAMVTNYLTFWNKLKTYYRELKSICTQDQVVYQGLAYRLAFAKAESNQSYLPSDQHLVFLGLNALNTAESNLIQKILEQKAATVLWDTDDFFLSRDYHEAGKFIREIKNTWPYYRDNPFEFINVQFDKSKNLEIVSATGNLGIAQAASKAIQAIDQKYLKDTAIILADEQLLLPLLHAIPENVESYNITMGLSLDQLPIASFFLQLFKLHQESKDGKYYHKTLIDLLQSPYATLLAGSEARSSISSIKNNNLTHVQAGDLELEDNSTIALLLEPVEKPQDLLDIAKKLITTLKQQLIAKNDSRLELEQLLAMHEVVQELDEIARDNPEIKDNRTFVYLLRQLLPLKQLDFIGEPVQGLQIMGLLETRALDYKNIIMLSVNEGTLPAGKSHSSYIPYEMKRQFGLPVYSDKDSVYAYHFYRLLHRCQQATFIYNSETDTLGGGEKSRFLLQLEKDAASAHQISHVSYFHKVRPIRDESRTITKSPLYFQRLKQISQRGFSPSALTSYVRNPMDFFASKIMQVSDLEEVEENIALNTMGSIIHEALDKLYQPYTKHILSLQDFEIIKSQVNTQLDAAYYLAYKSTTQPVGKNRIIYEVSRHYIRKMINADRDLVAAGNELIIESVEQQLETIISLPELGSIKLHGKVDRVDRLDGQLRIIDYKTGSVTQRNVAINDDYQVLSEDYERSKAFQVLMYAYLYLKNHPAEQLEAGIISFKNFKSGFISFATKPNSRFQSQPITTEVMEQFEQQLFLLLQEIFNPDQLLEEKEV